MSLFKRKPKIIRGHTFSEYLARCGQEYIMGRGEIVKDPSKLKPNRRYWEINGEYYQVGWKREQQIAFTVVSSIALVATICLPIYFCVIAPRERYHDYRFKYWNNAPALKTLKEFVKDAVTPGNANYVPKEDRIATFDMDGTLFGERSPIYLEWMLHNDYCDELEKEHPLIKERPIDVPNEFSHNGDPVPPIPVTIQQVYDKIVDFRREQVNPEWVINDPDNREMVSLEMAEAYTGASIFSDLTINEYTDLVNNYLEKDAEKFNHLKNKDMFYMPMIEVVEYLQQNNFNVYVVSGTDRFMVRTIISKHLHVPYDNVIGMDVQLRVDEDGEIIRTDELLVKNVKEAKVHLIMQEIGKHPVLSFGNSSGDVDMHDFALTHNKYKSQAYMVLADDNDREIGYSERTIQKRTEDWEKNGYQIFSMKNDWKTIYGDDVTLK